jgi:glycosyltransferase involved in cell wall biosynthesis
MNILWITNTIFPSPSKLLGIPEPVVGGWMYGLANQIASTESIQLAVATTYTGNELKTFEIDGVLYYLLPCHISTGYSKSLEPFWQKICADFQPDLVHIHGTEFAHGLACMRNYPSLSYIVSIQGLVSVYARYYYAGLSLSELLKSITFRDILRFDTLFQAKNKFVKRGGVEKEYIQRTKHIIGRTSWDYAHTKAINLSVNYHFCNETLRNSFYTSPKWSITNKTDYTIFLSQASYPIKGLHQVLKAVALLKKDYPQIKVRVAGHSIINTATLMDKIKLGGYGAYIKKLINQLKLHDQVQFMGSLTEEQMIAEYLNAHLFICPSCIENSPNSLGEAQLLGVPVIASYVGGHPNFINNGETGFLYPFDEVEMLAEHIRNLFTNTPLALSLSKNGIRVAEKRHHQKINLKQMINIYQTIIK